MSDLAAPEHDPASRAVPSLGPVAKRDALCLFLSSLLLIAFFTHVLPGTNDGSRYSLAMALATTGSAEIGPIYNSLLGDSAIDKAKVGDKYYCDKAPLGAFIAAPAVWLSSRATDSLFVNYYVASIVGAGIPGALCPALFYLFLIGVGVSRVRSLVTGLSLLVCTNLLYWSTLMFSHSLSAFLVLAGITIALYARKDWQYAAAGLLAGLSVSSDYYLLLVLPFLGLWIWKTRSLRAAIAVTIGGAVAGIFPAVYHTVIFGDPFVLPYKYADHFGYLHSQGVYGAGVPRVGAALDILAGDRFGLFRFNPILLLGIPGFYFLWKKDRWLTVLCGGSFVALLALASGHLDVDYGFGSSWGPRYLVPVYFAPLVAAAFLPAKFLGRPATVLAAASLTLNAALPMIYYPPPRGQGLQHLAEQLVPVVQRYGGMSTPAQYFAAHTRYYPQLIEFSEDWLNKR